MKLVRQTIQCAVLVLLTAATAFSQQLESGSLLTIQGTINGTSVNLAVYDSQIHSATVLTSPCDSGKGYALVTDAYVLQGGSPTGCDNGAQWAVYTVKRGGFTFTGNGYSFGVVTGGYDGGCNSPGNTGPIEPICVGGPDGATGFLDVKNNSTTSFTGTITLAGTSTGCAPASDSFTGTLNPGDSRRFGLDPDSLACGGYTATQTQTLKSGATIKFPFGVDDYEVAAVSNAGGEQITLSVAPVLQSSSNPGSTPSNTFNPGTMFSTFSCAPYGDFSETGNFICPEFQLGCSGASDCETFLYTATTHYTFPPGVAGIGGPGFLKASGQTCPSSLFDKNIFLFYSSDVTHQGSGGGHSCFVAAFTPNDPIIQGNFSAFVGFQGFSNMGTNPITPGQIVPLEWTYYNTAGMGVTNLNYCNSPSPAPGSCTAPWVNLGTVTVNCPGGPKGVHSSSPTPIGGGPLMNDGGGTYTFNWQTSQNSGGCVNVVATFDTGLMVGPDVFQFVK